MKRLYVLAMLALGLFSLDLQADAETVKRQFLHPTDSRWLPGGSYAYAVENTSHYNNENDILDCKNCTYDKAKDVLSCDCLGREESKRRTVSGCRGKAIMRSELSGRLVCGE